MICQDHSLSLTRRYSERIQSFHRERQFVLDVLIVPSRDAQEVDTGQ